MMGEAINALSMPWIIVEYPYLDTTRLYVQWPDGVNRPATEEEIRIWNYVGELTQKIEELEAKASSPKRR